METGSKLRLGDVFVGIPDPRQGTKVVYDLVELLVVAVCSVLVGADTFVENQPTLADSMLNFWTAFQAAPNKTPHKFNEVIEKDPGRLEVRRCYVFDQLDCLPSPARWPDLKSFGVIVSERMLKGKTSVEHRYYINSLAPDAAQLNHAVRQHWAVETRLHWCMDVAFNDDQMRARTDHSAHNLSVLRHFALNLIRYAPVKRKGGLKVQRLRAASNVEYREILLGLL